MIGRRAQAGDRLIGYIQAGRRRGRLADAVASARCVLAVAAMRAAICQEAARCCSSALGRMRFLASAAGDRCPFTVLLP